MIGRGKALRYFDVNHETGAVSIKDDLRKEMDTEYLVIFFLHLKIRPNLRTKLNMQFPQIDVRAYDLADPPLDSVVTVKVNVDHVATVAPDVGVGFSEIDYSVDVPESSVGGTVLKKLVIINKQDEVIPLDCKITSGNQDGLFQVKVTPERNCEVVLTRTSLDHEKVSEYEIQVELLTLPGVISRKNSIANIKIKIVDENDNSKCL